MSWTRQPAGRLRWWSSFKKTQLLSLFPGKLKTWDTTGIRVESPYGLVLLVFCFCKCVYMATIDCTARNYSSLWNSWTVTWIRKRHLGLHRHSGRRQTGETSILGQLSLVVTTPDMDSAICCLLWSFPQLVNGGRQTSRLCPRWPCQVAQPRQEQVSRVGVVRLQLTANTSETHWCVSHTPVIDLLTRS